MNNTISFHLMLIGYVILFSLTLSRISIFSPVLFWSGLFCFEVGIWFRIPSCHWFLVPCWYLKRSARLMQIARHYDRPLSNRLHEKHCGFNTVKFLSLTLTSKEESLFFVMNWTLKAESLDGCDRYITIHTNSTSHEACKWGEERLSICKALLGLIYLQSRTWIDQVIERSNSIVLGPRFRENGNFYLPITRWSVMENCDT